MKKYLIILLFIIIGNYIVSLFFVDLPYPYPAIQSFLNPLISKQYMFQQNELYSLKVFGGLSTITIGVFSMIFYFKEKSTLRSYTS